jgi:Ca2+-binding EF-hand superfamily protein
MAHAQTPVTSTPSPAGVPPAIPAPVTQPLPANRWTAAQIREAFQLADANADGQLTRAEAQHLPLMPRTFEESDLNKDGLLTLDEYQASFSPP